LNYFTADFTVATGLVNSELVNITEQVDTGAVVLERDTVTVITATSITVMAITDRVDSLPEVTGQADLVGLVPINQLDTGQVDTGRVDTGRVDTGQDGTGQVDKDTD
jgi:hypothetical protein